jgi:hypothetical protein
MTSVSLGLALLYLAFAAQAQTNVCIESLQSTGCMLRWEIDASTVTGSSSQTNIRTSPNILFKLDYQWAGNKESIVSHLIFKTGYTQVPIATKIQGIGTATPATDTAAIPQQAFVVEAGGTAGWTLGRSGQGTFTEIGGGVRGSFQDILQNNQIIQRGGLSYVDLSSANLTTAVGLYEATGHFKLSSIGHDRPASNVGGHHNVSSLLVIEAGYQNNSGLQQLGRNRLVGRFYAYPEISSTNHTKILVGLEYSAGIEGGAKIIQVFFGTNLNPAKLLHPN